MCEMVGAVVRARSEIGWANYRHDEIRSVEEALLLVLGLR